MAGVCPVGSGQTTHQGARRGRSARPPGRNGTPHPCRRDAAPATVVLVSGPDPARIREEGSMLTSTRDRVAAATGALFVVLVGVGNQLDVAGTDQSAHPTGTSVLHDAATQAHSTT